MNSDFNNIDKYSSNIALIGPNYFRLTYRQLVDQAEEFGQFVERRCLVFIVCDDSTDCVVVYLSMILRGAVVALVQDGVWSSTFKSLVETYAPEFVLLPTVRSNEFVNCRPIAKYGQYTLLRTQHPYDLRLDNQLCLLLSTSGSTGSPKFVRLSYENIESNAHAIASYLNIGEHDRAIATMSISYTYGLSIIHSHLLYGASLIIPEASIVTRQFWEMFSEEGATTISGVPYIIHMLDRLGFQKKKLPTLQYITQAGGKLDKTLAGKFLEYCRARGIRFITMYGQTEASPRISYLPWEFASEKQGSIGKAIPGGQLWLEDENHNEINNSFSHGEIVYKGPNVMMGYAYSRNELGTGDEMKGVLHTGDIGYRDIDGFYYVTGRKTRFVKLFGIRISLDEVEEMLKNEGYECACTGDDETIQIYVAGPKTHANITSLLEKRIGINSAGYTVIYLDKIPTLSSGKIAYSELVETE